MRRCASRRTELRGQQIAAAFSCASMDFAGSARGFGYSGGRNLVGLEQDAKRDDSLRKRLA